MTNAAAPEAHRPFWLPTGQDAVSYPPPEGNIEVDVAVVGAGIVGLTAACFLLSAGREVAVFEARRVGRQATGRSTAKVTSQHGRRYKDLIGSIGKSSARRYAAANERAIGRIRHLCGTFELDCGLEILPAFVFAETEEEAAALREEAEAAASLGLPASFVREVDLPFAVAGALRFDDQSQFDPYRYLMGLAAVVARDGALFENTRATRIEHGEPCRLQAGDVTVTAGDVIVATQMPVIGDGMLFAKCFPVAHPMAAAPLPDAVRLDGMFISSGSPTHSFRAAEQNGQRYVVAVGGEYKTGVPEELEAQFDDLRGFLRRGFGIERLSHAWVNEDFRPMDELAFIGPVNSSKPNLHVAVGFDAWGITQGVAAAEIIADKVLGHENEDAEVFDASRVRPLAGGAELLSENLKAGARLAGDRLLRRQVQSLEDIPDGEGGIIERDGEQLAVTRNGDGVGQALSAVCTHLGCIVGWNAIDRTWDCPCHGSRFDEQGQVLAGPALQPLERKPLRTGPPPPASTGESAARRQ